MAMVVFVFFLIRRWALVSELLPYVVTLRNYLA